MIARGVPGVLATVLAVALAGGCSVRKQEPSDSSQNVEPQTVVEVVDGAGKLMVLAGWPEAALGLHELQGQVLLLDFTAIWSAPARSQLSGLGSLHDEYKGRNFQVLGMVLDQGDPGELTKQALELDLPYPLLRTDEETLLRFGGVRSIPTRILLDRKGEVRYRYAGTVDLALIRADLEKLVVE